VGLFQIPGLKMIRLKRSSAPYKVHPFHETINRIGYGPAVPYRDSLQRRLESSIGSFMPARGVMETYIFLSLMLQIDPQKRADITQLLKYKENIPEIEKFKSVHV
jgi:hypothetical protein